MHPETALRWSWMNVLNAKRAEILRSRFGSLENALSKVSLEFLQELGCREEGAMIAMNRLEELDIRAYSALLVKKGITLISDEDDAYPASLKTIPDRPVFLYARGDMNPLKRPCIALVGSRDMNDEGRRIVEAIVPGLIAAGCTTVSGLAYGVDAAIADETLRRSGMTVAVLGSGFAELYPKANERLAERIVSEGGLILSEFPLDQRPDKYTFPARNRIIAGLSLSTVVIQAAEGSGSLITAELALEYGRDVAAVPGSVFDPLFAGCHRLLASGQAQLVVSADQILLQAGIVAPLAPPSDTPFASDDPREMLIMAKLTSLPCALDDLVLATSLDAATLIATLTMLELKGVARKVGGQWVRA